MLKNQTLKLPLNPGVYIYIDSKGKPLYVGRATSLRRRVLQYFRPDIDPRIREMVSLAKKIRHVKTDTVLEAIILEANLIKKYWPKYNIVDKDDRSFVFVVIPKTDFAKPIIVRQRELVKFPSSGAHIFGPFFSLSLLKNALKILRRVFPYSLCVPNSNKACFDYQVGLCPGACVGAISKKQYQENINNIILIFKGEKKKLMKKLSKENPNAAKAFKHIQDVTLISRDEFTPSSSDSRIEGYDISHFSGKETYGSMVVFTNGKADNSQYRLFKIRGVGNNDLESLKEMLERRFKHKEWPMPNIIMIDGGRPQISYVTNFFEKNNIIIPFVGISKLNGDRLVFPTRVKKTTKELLEAMKPVLISARDEAHRFAIKAHRRARRKMM